ncbi:ABC transporter permease [Nesterenkonia sp. PF2B19]|uniref:ABC transporter permease n=1 Tax=Nesterenkonia sp. PF2B19 TaxID=1881858 RepID=UPI000A19D394|nr:ABC transporter permease [Nesterenkonia sp. PF2B19]OSM42762.1 ABC transporter permease [Nesterenkonia sp. PF2B19]
MLKFLALRAVRYAVMTFAVTSLAYLMAVSFFNPEAQLADIMGGGVDPEVSRANVQDSLRRLDLDPDQNALQRYWVWLTGILTQWDWGRTPNGGYVNDEFAIRVWISTQLTLVATVMTMVIGILLGVYAAARQYRFGDRASTWYSYFTMIVPVPVAYLLVQRGAIWVNEAAGQQIFYVTGFRSIGVEGTWNQFVDMAAHYTVPTVAMTLFGWASMQISQRQYLLDFVNADFVRTARATGLTRSQAIRKHALRVSFVPTAQSIAFTIPALFTGTVMAEMVFNWDGLGSWGLRALHAHDVNASVAIVFYGCIIFAIGAMLADFFTSLVDPRVRL